MPLVSNARRSSRLSALCLRTAQAALVVALFASHAVQAATLTGEVVGVTDGDTLTLLDANHVQYKIRLAGIDAPEKKQDFGERSKESLAAAVFRKAIVVEWDKYDRYGRVIGKVMVNGRDANLMQVSSGLAWHYKQYAKEQAPGDVALYANAEDHARAGRLGLWSRGDAVPPWDFRKHGHKTSALAYVR